MKKIITISGAILFLIKFSLVNAQNWTNAQILEANTAKDIEYLTKIEKECVMYINLCRLYPKEFLNNELLNYYGPEKKGDYLKNSKYRKSLIDLLSTMKSLNALNFDVEAYNNAKCFAKEQGEAGTTGHTRINCKKGNYAECCSYGMHTGKDIVMQLLIDHNVPGLGHRINCLNNEYTKIGLSVQPHKKWEYCAVIDMIW
jgi:hypothetical protein